MRDYAFVFDLNGVLFWDTHFHDNVWRQYSRKLRGYELSDNEMLHKVHGKTNKDILEYLMGRSLSNETIKQHTDEKESIYQKLCLDNPNEFKLAPGAIELLTHLKQHNKPRAIATSSELGNVLFFYKYLNLEKWFDFDLIAFDDGAINGKPAPDLYNKAFEKLDLRGANCLVIEDSEIGIESAHSAGAGMIIALATKENQAMLSKLEGVNRTIINFYELLESIKKVIFSQHN